MNPVTELHISDTIFGHYPGTQYFNQTLLGEMFKMMTELGVTTDEFDKVFQMHRSNEQKARYTPQSADLLAMLPKVRNGDCNLTGSSSSRALNEFNSMAVTHGWSYAFRVSRKDIEQKQVLDKMGIDEMSEPFATFPVWRKAFVQMLHNDTDKMCFLHNVADAFDYGAANCPDNLKEKMLKDANWFRHVGSKTARSYFPVFRPKKMENRESIKKFANMFLKNSKMVKFIHLDKKG